MTDSKDKPSLNPVTMFLAAASSLKLTVVLLALCVLLVFAGTTVQVYVPLSTVIYGMFRCWWTWIDYKAFTVFFNPELNPTGGFPFPGGWLLGSLLLMNLVISHAKRIKVKATGNRLFWGWGVLAVGVLLTWVVISKVFNGDSSQDDIAPYLRVAIQLVEGGGAGIILFLGCHLLFAKKAGIVLLHGGVVLMMVSELVTGLYAEEAMMTVHEGESSNYAVVQKEVELAIIDGSASSDMDAVVVVPSAHLQRDGRIELPGLPFDLEVSANRYFPNSDLKKLDPHHDNPATDGLGLKYRIHEQSVVKKDDVRNFPGTYVTFVKNGTDEKVGTWLVSLYVSLSDIVQEAPLMGKTYRIELREKRVYKPYSLYLYDFRFERYPGTETPKDYSSFVRLTSGEPSVERDVRIWMNNPLRYGGDTIYQASFDAATEKATVLQVVENRGWMVPYVACMIVAIGLLGQFTVHLLGFIRKRRMAT